MITSLPVCRAVVLVWISAASLAFSQNVLPRQALRPSMPGMPMQTVPAGIGMPLNSSVEPAKSLSKNYRIVFTGKLDDKALGELSALTCSPRVAIGGPLSDAEFPTTFEVSGSLEERPDGQILFDYQVSFSVPVLVKNAVAAEKGGVVSPSYNYQRHICSGSLLMKPGKVYDLLKVGGTTHSVMIAPEAEK